MGKLRKVIEVKHQAERLCGEGAYMASSRPSPRPVHASRLQRDAVLGFSIGSSQAVNIARFDRAAENPNTGKDVIDNGIPWRMDGYRMIKTP